MTAHECKQQLRWDRLDGAAHIRGFNYQPTWGRNGYEVWLGFDAERYRAELTRGKELFPSMNTVRIWLSWSAWKLDPGGVTRAMRQAVDVVTDLGLLAIPVFFSRWRGHPEFDQVAFGTIRNADYEQAFAPFVRSVVEPQVGNPAILAWDLCNEAIQEASQLAWASEQTWDFEVVLDGQFEWLEKHRRLVKSLDPDVPTCAGYMCVFPNVTVQERFEALGDILTPHLYPSMMWAHAGRKGSLTEFADRFVGDFIDDLRKRGVQKPVVSTECCWGSLDDAERADYIRAELSAFRKHGVGALPHALWCSPVADLHPPEMGPVVGHGYMGFIESDGTLREGHGVFNDV